MYTNKHLPYQARRAISLLRHNGYLGRMNLNQLHNVAALAHMATPLVDDILSGCDLDDDIKEEVKAEAALWVARRLRQVTRRC